MTLTIKFAHVDKMLEFRYRTTFEIKFAKKMPRPVLV